MHALGEVGAMGAETDIAMSVGTSPNLNILLPMLVLAFLKLWKFWFQTIFGGFQGTPFSYEGHRAMKYARGMLFIEKTNPDLSRDIKTAYLKWIGTGEIERCVC